MVVGLVPVCQHGPIDADSVGHTKLSNLMELLRECHRPGSRRASEDTQDTGPPLGSLPTPLLFYLNSP